MKLTAPCAVGGGDDGAGGRWSCKYGTTNTSSQTGGAWGLLMGVACAGWAIGWDLPIYGTRSERESAAENERDFL